MHQQAGVFFLGGENWTGLKKDQLVRVGCDTCKIPEKCETVFGSLAASLFPFLIDKHLTLADENRKSFFNREKEEDGNLRKKHVFCLHRIAV